MALKILATAKATNTGGRNGHSKSDDGLVDVELSVPKSMGGPGKPGTTTPEHLFAAGYAACFGGACDYQAHHLKLVPKTMTINSTVNIGQTDDGGFGLSVVLEVVMTGLSQADAEKVVAAGDQICPYSKAIRGNVEVKISVVAKG